MSAPERVWVCYDPRYEHLNAVSADESRASHMRQMDESLYEYVLASSYDAIRAERDALRVENERLMAILIGHWNDAHRAEVPLHEWLGMTKERCAHLEDEHVGR